MRKFFLLFCVCFITSANADEPKSCVPRRMNNPGGKQYIQYSDDLYLQCGGTGKTAYICKEKTVIPAYNGNLYECKNKEWVELINIDDCTQNMYQYGLEQVENKHNGISNLGSVSDDAKYFYYFDAAPDVGYSAIQNYCRYPLENFNALRNACNGIFMYWGDAESEGVNPCYDKINLNSDQTNPDRVRRITDQNNVSLAGVTIMHGNDKYTTNENGSVSIPADQFNGEASWIFSKEGFETRVLSIADIKKIRTIVMKNSETTPDTENNNSDQSSTSDTDTDATLKKAQEAYEKARDNEQSIANRLVTGVSTAATGLGAMQAASALAKQRVLAESENDMKKYLSTFKCEYGTGQSVDYGATETLMPSDFLDYYKEYEEVADSLKATKTALGLRDGIESEVLYKDSNLYQYTNKERQTTFSDDVFSLARAMTDNDSDDATALAAQKEQNEKQLKVGGYTTLGGLAVGVGGNLLIDHINNKDKENK